MGLIAVKDICDITLYDRNGNKVLENINYLNNLHIYKQDNEFFILLNSELMDTKLYQLIYDNEQENDFDSDISDYDTIDIGYSINSSEFKLVGKYFSKNTNNENKESLIIVNSFKFEEIDGSLLNLSPCEVSQFDIMMRCNEVKGKAIQLKIRK